MAAKQAVVDGEVIALDERGEPDFALLQARIKGRGAAAEPTRSSTRSSTCSTSTADRSSTSRSRSAGLLGRPSARIRASA